MKIPKPKILSTKIKTSTILTIWKKQGNPLIAFFAFYNIAYMGKINILRGKKGKSFEATFF